jgi:hypothetical protein
VDSGRALLGAHLHDGGPCVDSGRAQGCGMSSIRTSEECPVIPGHVWTLAARYVDSRRATRGYPVDFGRTLK